MKQKKQIDLVPVIFVMLLCIAAGFLISKALKFGLSKYNEFWRDNNVAYGSDLDFFGQSAIDQDEKPLDSSLRDSALKLLYAHINGQTAKSCGSNIQINDRFFQMLDPNYNIKTTIDSWCSLSAFLVLQSGDKAIVAFEYSIIPESTEKAEEYCKGSFKTRPLSRMYLKRIEGIWTVTDMLIIQ